MDWAYLASKGVSRGALLMCEKRIVEKLEKFIREYTVACSFKSVEDNFLWAFAGVYGLNKNKNRHLLWEELARTT